MKPLYLIVLVCIFSSCNEASVEHPQRSSDIEQLKTSYAIRSSAPSKSASPSVVYNISSRKGHKRADCNNLCPNVHIACSGHGQECSMDASIDLRPYDKSFRWSSPSQNISLELDYIGQTVYPEDLTDMDFLDMPARSFYCRDEGVWMNIPMQRLGRDGQTRCFTLHRIRFTAEPSYTNR